MTKLTEEDKEIIEKIVETVIMYHIVMPIAVDIDHYRNISKIGARTVVNMLNNIENGTVIYSFMDTDGKLKR